jgi:hypothetical protein
MERECAMKKLKKKKVAKSKNINKRRKTAKM